MANGNFIYIKIIFNFYNICYRACIDTTEIGNLENGVFLGEYSLTHEYAPLTQEDQLNVTINVHDDGDTLEIASVCCKSKKHYYY